MLLILIIEEVERKQKYFLCKSCNKDKKMMEAIQILKSLTRVRLLVMTLQS